MVFCEHTNMKERKPKSKMEIFGEEMKWVLGSRLNVRLGQATMLDWYGIVLEEPRPLMPS